MADTVGSASQAPARGSGESPATPAATGSAVVVAGSTSAFTPADAGDRCPVCHGPTVASFQRALGQPEHLMCSGPTWLVRSQPVLYAHLAMRRGRRR